jgi:hypothetical protein
MEKNIKEVAFSSAFFNDLKSVYEYGTETFGKSVADYLYEQIFKLLANSILNHFITLSAGI